MPVLTLGPVKINYLQLPPSQPKASEVLDVVLIHGLGANLGFWFFNIAPALADLARVTLFDLRGHGRSSMPPAGYRLNDFAADLGALLDHLEIRRPHLVGHSLGGAVMTNYVVHHPQRPASLTFVDVRLKLFQPTMTLADWPSWPLVQPLLDEMGIVLHPEQGELSYQLLREIARLQWEAPERGEALRSRLSGSLLAGFGFSHAGGRRTAGTLLQLLDRTTALPDLSREDGLTRSQLQAINCPVAGVYGGASQTLSTLSALESVWPRLRSWVIPEAGHFFPTTQPKALIVPLREFLSEMA